KTHAIIEDIIETSHNGIVSWERRSNVFPILIEGTDDHTETKKRWEILRQYFEENNISYKEVFSENGGILSKIMCLIYLLDFTTIYNAIILGVDPSPVKSINFIKEKL
ncbi:MAG: glucose-6-phosphate isomerase, partial [Thaumarchaeota archaeon]